MTDTGKFYNTVINDVISGVSEDFAEEGCEQTVLEELKSIWMSKLRESKAVDLDGQEQTTLSSTQYALMLNPGTKVGSHPAAIQQTGNNQLLQQKGSITAIRAATNLVTSANAPNNNNSTTFVSSASAAPIAANNRPVYTIQPSNQPAQLRPNPSNQQQQQQNLTNAAQVAQMALNNSLYQNSQLQRVTLSNAAHMTPHHQYSMYHQPRHQGQVLMTGPMGSDMSVSGGQQHHPTLLLHRPPQGGQGLGNIIQLQTGTGTPLLLATSGAQQTAATDITIKNQTDGPADSSSEEDDDDDDDDMVNVSSVEAPSRMSRLTPQHPMMSPMEAPHSTLTSAGMEDDDLDEEEEVEEDKVEGEAEEPLNSGDDVSDEEADKLFEAENVVVCQYDKINRSRNKWRFHLKDGIMTLNGRDSVFQKANGDAEW